MLVSLYVLVNEWWEHAHLPSPRKPGSPPSLSDSEVLTLAILSQWPRFRSERVSSASPTLTSEDISRTS
jgi:hypothetical protein